MWLVIFMKIELKITDFYQTLLLVHDVDSHCDIYSLPTATVLPGFSFYTYRLCLIKYNKR